MDLLKMMLAFEFIEVNFTLDSLQAYLTNIHADTDARLKKLENRYDELSAKYPGQEGKIWQIFDNDHYMYKSRFGNFMNHSVLLTACSSFEVTLKIIDSKCKEFVKSPSATHKWNKGLSYVENYFTSIKCTTGAAFSSSSFLWRNINLYQKVRNLIAHECANIMIDRLKDLNEQKDYHLISSIPNVRLDEDGTFYLPEEFVQKAINDIKVFFASLRTELDNMSDSGISV